VRSSLDDRNLRAPLGGCGCELQPDEATADHDHLARLGETGAQDVCVGDGAQQMHAVELGPGDRQRPRARAEREHEVLVAQRAP